MMPIKVRWKENKRRPEGSVEFVGAMYVRGIKAWTASMPVVRHPSGWTVYGLGTERFAYPADMKLEQVLIRTCEKSARIATSQGQMALARELRAFARSRTVGA